MRLKRPALSQRGVSSLKMCGALALVFFLIPISPPLLGAQSLLHVTFSESDTGQPIYASMSAPTALAPVGPPESPQSPEEASQKTVLRLGFNPVDGNWFEREVRINTRAFAAVQSIKLATLTGLIPRNTLAYTQTDFSASVTVGRNQDKNFDIYDQAELVVGVAEQAVGSLPLSLSYSVSGGWFREPLTLQTSRVQYLVGFEMPSVALGPKIAWEASGSWQYAIYGNAARQAVLKADAKLTLRRDEMTSVNLGYDVLGVVGATPFAFDAVDPKDLASDLSLEYMRTENRAPDVTTSFHDGFSYSFLDRTVSFIIGYSLDTGGRLHWDSEVEYDLASHETDVTFNYGAPVGRGTDFSIHAKYLGGTTLFKDLDYTITSQIQDCTKLTAKYRQVHQEFWLELDPQSCRGEPSQDQPNK